MNVLARAVRSPRRSCRPGSDNEPVIAAVRLDDGMHDGQPHAHTFGLAGVEQLEDFFQFVIGNARSAIRYG